LLVFPHKNVSFPNARSHATRTGTKYSLHKYGGMNELTEETHAQPLKQCLTQWLHSQRTETSSQWPWVSPTETVIRRLRRKSAEHLKVTHVKLEPLYTVGRVVNRCSHQACKSLQKLKIQLLYDPVIPLLGIYPKELKSGP